MTIMLCMMDRLQRAPRSVTPHGHRPRVDGPHTPGRLHLRALVLQWRYTLTDR